MTDHHDLLAARRANDAARQRRWRERNHDAALDRDRRRAEAARLLRAWHDDEFAALVAEHREAGLNRFQARAKALTALRAAHPEDWTAARREAGL